MIEKRRRDRCSEVDVRLPGKGNSNVCGARPVHLIITMIKQIRTSKLSMKNSLFAWQGPWGDEAFESTEQEAFEDVPGYNRCASPARVRVATGS